MALHLSVASSSASLARVLADELSRPTGDPFTPEVIAIPGDGVRAWLSAELAQYLGATGAPAAAPDGIIANVEFMFPAALVRRAIGHRQVYGREPSRWEVGPLGWAIHDILHSADHDIGIQADAVRCRSLADLFDRYALHRPTMLRRWEAGQPVDPFGRQLPEHLCWQPRLWQALCVRLGHPSGPAELTDAANQLRIGRCDPALPARVFLFGLASLPAPHLAVLSSLATRIDVHVLAPVWSPVVWNRVMDAVRSRPLLLPIDRAEDITAAVSVHPLGPTWARAPREAQLLLAAMAADAQGVITSVDPVEPQPVAGRLTVLAALQSDLRSDHRPPGPPADGNADQRLVLDPEDRSLQWHRCHGAARQAEVLRDVVIHLLEETNPDGTARFQPRDIAVLCPDPGAFAPLIEAAFAGDPEHGVPGVPLQVADRSLRRDTPLLQATAALLDLLDGRFRSSEVFAFAALGPVSRRFGFTPERLGHLADQAARANIRWGLDVSSRPKFGVPVHVDGNTWQSGLDQLLVGAAMADAELLPAGMAVEMGPGDTVAASNIEGDLVEMVGALADMVDALSAAVIALGRPLPVGVWCETLAEAMRSLCSVDDAEAWQWQSFDSVVSGFVADADLPGELPAQVVPAQELATLLVTQLGGRPGRVRFGTGSVTLSSLTAQRGVPHRVICLVGLDGDLGAGVLRSDDLMALTPCVGDRDQRSELRAQLLDALMSAGDMLVITSTGVDLRTNGAVPPAVPLAELTDLIDASVRSSTPDRTASESLARDHPRHAWSDRNLRPGLLGTAGPWSFDRGALASAHARATRSTMATFLAAPLPPDMPLEVDLAELERALCNPVRTLLSGRLGISLQDAAEGTDDLIPLRLDGLAAWKLRDRLLTERIRSAQWDQGAMDQWANVQHRSGLVPPLGLGDAEISRAASEIEDILNLMEAECGERLQLAHCEQAISIELEGRRVAGVVSGLRGHLLIDVRASRLKDEHLLVAWCRLVALTCALPEHPWEAVLIGRNTAKKPVAESLRVRSPQHARAALDLIVDTFDRARCTLIPALPGTTALIHRKGLHAGRGSWSSYQGLGDGDDRWVRLACGELEYSDLIELAPLSDEEGPGWSSSNSRVQRWADRIWGAFDESVTRTAPGSELGAKECDVD